MRKKQKESKLPLEERKNIIKIRREADRTRAKAYRDRVKMKKKCQGAANDNCKTTSLNGIVLKSYSCPQTIGKVLKALLNTPKRKQAVLLQMFSKLDDAGKNGLANILTSPPQTMVCSNELIVEINGAVRDFFERDDISRVSPKARDVRFLTDPVTGSQVIVPKRHMVLSLREAFSVFVEERKNANKGICSLSHFKKLRPENIWPINDLPHNVCLCSYHPNYIEAVDALHKVVPSIPNYDNGFVRQFLCAEPTIDCWFSKCGSCPAISIEKLNLLLGETSLTKNVSWKIWKKNHDNKRVELHDEKGTLSDLIVHIIALTPHFFKHCYVKREQADTFNIDSQRAKSDQFCLEGLLQIDFAENFVCESQDEVQSAHWNQRQLTLFTSAFTFNEIFESKVLVSNIFTHTKETIVPYLYKLISAFPSTLKVLKIWSDGPSSQCKNKFITAIIPALEATFCLKIYWNYFAAFHGKGCIGAIAKTVVRNHVRARDCTVNSASDFANAFKWTQSKIAVEEMTDSEIVDINLKLKATSVFSNARNVRHISSAHHINFNDGGIKTFETSKLEYN